MSDGKKYYCFCSSNCKYETMTKEQILTAIAQAVETGSVGDCDTGFITKVKETNGGRAVTFWVGTQAQYNALGEIAENCVYIITDDTLRAELEKALAETQQKTAEVESAIAALQGKEDSRAIKYYGRFPSDEQLEDFAKSLFNSTAARQQRNVAFVTTDATKLAENTWVGEFYKIDPNTGLMMVRAFVDIKGIRQVAGKVTADGVIWYDTEAVWGIVGANG